MPDWQNILAAEASMYEFVKQAWPLIEPETEYKDGPHIAAVCVHLEALLAGEELVNLICNIPPGCMKSMLFGVFFPAWAWISRPSTRFMMASYDQSLSTRDAIKCRQIISSPWYQRNWGDRYQLTGDQNEKTKYENDRRGWRISTSVGGRGLGEHPDVIVIDDANNVKNIGSALERQTVIDWYDGLISARGKTRGVRKAIIMQRLHEDDLCGHILRAHADDSEYVHICLPMRYEPDRMQPTPLGWTDWRTEPGELLWPAAYTEKIVAGMERDLGSLRAAGQLQQRPVPIKGNLTQAEWFRLRTAAPAQMIARVRYWDKAGTEDGGAYTVGLLMAMDQRGQYWIEDVVRRQVSAHHREELMRQTADIDAARYGMVEQCTEVEPGSGGKESYENTVRKLAGHYVTADRVAGKGDKVQRFMPFAAQAEAGNVHIVAAPWNKDYLDEVTTFPRGRYKDQADASSGAFARLTFGRNRGTIEGEVIASGDPESVKDEHRPFSDEELAELPDFLREIVLDSRTGRRGGQHGSGGDDD